MAAVSATLLLVLPVGAANSVSTVSGNTTITWSWSEDRQVGQFVNGEWWVVGPITLTSITPADPNPGDATDLHGSMLNLKAEQQGWSNHTSNIAGVYVQSLNIARQLPYVVGATNSIVTLQSLDGGAQGFESGAVLTVVDSPVATGTFRPPLYGNTKPANWRNWTEASLNYAAFQNLAPTANAPNPTSSSLRAAVNYLLIDIRTGGGQGNTNMKITGSGGGEGYGRGIANNSVGAVLALNCNYTNAQKRDLLVSVVQRGIDAYGGVLAGYVAPPDGGHNHGRKLLFAAAAAALGDSDMIAKLNSATFKRFQEDAYYIFVDQQRIDTPHWNGEDNYTQAMLGMPDWGDLNRVDRSTPDWTYSGYRYINGSPGVGFVLCATLMGLREEINNEAYFRYIIERYFPILDGRPSETGWPRVPNDSDSASMPGIGATNGINRGVYEMWNAYFKDGAPPPPPTPVVVQAAPPAVSPAGGTSVLPITVSLSSATPDSTIRYTTDGTTPNSNSSVYTAPFQLSQSATVKAIASAADLSDSPVQEAKFSIGSFTSNGEWQSVAMPEGWTTVSFTLIPSASPLDSVVGLGDVAPVSAYTDLACAVRFNPQGFIDARNGSAYGADQVMTYAAGKAYHFSMTVNMVDRRYNVVVTPEGGSAVQIATGYAFRTEQALIGKIDTLSFLSREGTTAISKVSGSGAIVKPPTPPSGLRLAPSP